MPCSDPTSNNLKKQGRRSLFPCFFVHMPAITAMMLCQLCCGQRAQWVRRRAGCRAGRDRIHGGHRHRRHGRIRLYHRPCHWRQAAACGSGLQGAASHRPDDRQPVEDGTQRQAGQTSDSSRSMGTGPTKLSTVITAPVRAFCGMLLIIDTGSHVAPAFRAPWTMRSGAPGSVQPAVRAQQARKIGVVHQGGPRSALGEGKRPASWPHRRCGRACHALPEQLERSR